MSLLQVMCHMPAVCEEKSLPYIYTPSRSSTFFLFPAEHKLYFFYSRQDLGTAMGVKRGCLMVMVREHEDYKDLYDEVT